MLYHSLDSCEKIVSKNDSHKDFFSKKMFYYLPQTLKVAELDTMAIQKLSKLESDKNNYINKNYLQQRSNVSSALSTVEKYIKLLEGCFVNPENTKYLSFLSYKKDAILDIIGGLYTKNQSDQSTENVQDVVEVGVVEDHL